MLAFLTKIVGTFCLWSIWFNVNVVADESCPNGFDFLAKSGEKAIELPAGFGSAYITFGSPEFYSISLISVTAVVNFKCEPSNLGKVDNILPDANALETGKILGLIKPKPDGEKRGVCCVCPVEDAEEAQMLLFPKRYNEVYKDGGPVWTASGTPLEHGMYWIGYKKSEGLSYDALTLSNHPSETGCGPLKKRTKLEALRIFKGFTDTRSCRAKKIPDAPDPPDLITGHPCYPSESVCNTKNAITLTVFIISTKVAAGSPNQRQVIKAAYSKTGIFNVPRLLRDIYKPASPDNEWEVKYMTMEEFYIATKVDLPEYDKTKVKLQWTLASFCASCPSNSVTVTTSEKKVVTQKERIQQALALGASGTWNTKVTGKYTASVAWTGSFFNELNEALSVGTSVSNKATCNGFYVYHFNVNIGSQRTGFSAIPSQYFYCSDRPYPPQCVPPLSGYELVVGDKTRVCVGYDINYDFGVGGDEKYGPWRSGHSGRGSPIKIVEMAKAGKKRAEWIPPYNKKSGSFKAVKTKVISQEPEPLIDDKHEVKSPPPVPRLHSYKKQKEHISAIAHQEYTDYYDGMDEDYYQYNAGNALKQKMWRLIKAQKRSI